MKTIGMMLDAPYPEDGRVTKEAIALLDAGYRVAILCVRRNGEVQREVVKGIDVYRVSRSLGAVAQVAWDSINALLWHHPVFTRALPRFIAECNVDALHVHDLPLAGSAARVARRLRLPWVLDLHENYPAGLQIWSEHKTNPIVRLKNRLLMSYERWVSYERRMCMQATAIITVVEEMRQRLVRVHGLPIEKIWVVTNSEWRNFYDQFPSLEEVRESFPGEYVILYLGYYGPHRGLDTVIEAMPEILATIPNARFVVVGRGSLRPTLEKLAVRLGVADRVSFLGLKPYAEVGSWMRRADINVTPHKRNEHTDHTIPHKLFHSLLSGRPTLVSSAPPLKRIAEETGGAHVFEAEDPVAFARAVVRIYSDERHREAVANAGVAASLEGPYNWDTDQQHLIELYATLSL